MKYKFSLVKALGTLSVGLILVTNLQANQLSNGDFESHPPSSGWGNHIGYSISPWVIAGGSKSNVIRVDQGQSYKPTRQGPHRDASNAPKGKTRHYLDIANGSNQFYQIFKSRCSGTATFGGYFSTRGNGRGNAQVTLRNGSGFNGSIVGQTNQISLPRGSSATDPWKRVVYTGAVQAGQVYSFVVAMDNNMNFDEAFVSVDGCKGDEHDDNGGIGGTDWGKPIDLIIEKPIEVYLPKPQKLDNCCAPINKDVIMRQLTPVFQPNGGSNANYRLNFSATPQFNNQMQNYLNYVHSMKNPINALITTWRVYDKAPGGLGSPAPTSAGWGTKIEEFFTTFHITNPINHGNTSNSYQMKPNHWYHVGTGTYFNDGHSFFPKKCAESDYWVNWQVGTKSAISKSSSNGNFIIAQGGKIISKISVKSQTSSRPTKKRFDEAKIKRNKNFNRKGVRVKRTKF